MVPPPPLRRSARAVFIWILAVLATLVMIFSLIALTAGERRATSTAENVIATVLYPFQNAVGWVTNRVKGVSAAAQELFRLREENARLRAQVQRLEPLGVENQRLAQENARLREELGLNRRIPHHLLPAQVIGRDPSFWFQSVVINRGARDGVKEGMAVVNHKGLVGTVERVTPFTSTVRLLTAPDFQITIRDVQANEFGVVAGQVERVLIRFPYGNPAGIRTGDAVVTSGYNLMIPGDLYVGEIAALEGEGNDLVPSGILKPGVDFDHLDLVQVVLGRGSETESPRGEADR